MAPSPAEPWQGFAAAASPPPWTDHLPAPMPDGMAAFGIGGGGIWELFSTHPPLDKRIAALRANRG